MQTPEKSQNTNDTHWFNIHAPAPFKQNRRLGVRFVRDDIRVFVKKTNILALNFGSKDKDNLVKLIDISSRGVLIETDVKLQLKQKITLTIRFFDLREFNLNGIVVRKSTTEQSLYGIKFAQLDDRFAEYLIITQKKLTFK